jgi:hypothetical protein
MPELSKPITTYIAASNAHDADGCAACFTDDAVVLDERREMRGVAAVRDWMDAAIKKYQHVVEVITSAEADPPADVVMGLGCRGRWRGRLGACPTAGHRVDGNALCAFGADGVNVRSAGPRGSMPRPRRRYHPLPCRPVATGFDVPRRVCIGRYRARESLVVSAR